MMPPSFPGLNIYVKAYATAECSNFSLPSYLGQFTCIH
jgi:hypothetical protein